MLSGKDLRAYGSQGQVRTAVLSMKLGEIALIENEMGELPALLLDDVFSELDHQRRNALLQSTQGRADLHHLHRQIRRRGREGRRLLPRDDGRGRKGEPAARSVRVSQAQAVTAACIGYSF